MYLDDLMRRQIIVQIEKIAHRLEDGEYLPQDRRQDAQSLRHIIGKL